MEVVSMVVESREVVGIKSGRRRVVMSGMGVSSKSVVGREESSFVSFLDFFWEG